MKITFIGAGSLAFTKNVLTDILTFPALRKDVTICLEDIDKHRLGTMFDYLKKYKADNIEILKDLKIESTTNQQDAIKDARYIISAIQVGGLEAYNLDMEIPKKYGIHQVVGDSLGPGGVFRFLRTTNAFKSILNDIKKYGENATNNTGSKPIFLNYANPMAMNTWYCNSISPNSTIGLCHGVQGTANLLRQWIGAVYPNEFSYFCAGINHMAWFLKLWYRDPFEDPELTGPWNDAYPVIKEHFKEEPELMREEKIRIDMFKATGYFMTESSGHLSEYLPYYLKRKDLIEKYRSEGNTGFETLKQSYYYNENIAKLDKFEKEFRESFETERVGFKQQPSNEYASKIINARETGVPFVFNGNLINKDQGLITNLPRNCCVEVPITVDYQGFHPQGGIELPPVCQGLCTSNIMVQQAAVKGALELNKESIYHAILLDPNTASVLSPGEIREMVDEMFDAESKWLPQFN